jgi:hypothetical protein
MQAQVLQWSRSPKMQAIFQFPPVLFLPVFSMRKASPEAVVVPKGRKVSSGEMIFITCASRIFDLSCYSLPQTCKYFCVPVPAGS